MGLVALSRLVLNAIGKCVIPSWVIHDMPPTEPDLFTIVIKRAFAGTFQLTISSPMSVLLPLFPRFSRHEISICMRSLANEKVGSNPYKFKETVPKGWAGELHIKS